MVNILDIVRQRRSIRKYKKEIPSDVDIDRVLEAGRWAPSGLNNQPWRFMVIKDSAKKNGIAGFTKYGRVIQDAPLIIVVCMDIADSYNRDKDLMAIGACIQNMCLEAHFLGLGTCWLGEILNKKEALAKYLNLGKDLEVMTVVAVGYPNEEIKEYNRKPLSSLKI